MTNPIITPSTEAQISAFEQNHATFRSLNQQMWQIPLISMTLTGGLWFGVSGASAFPLFQMALLFLAVVGNTALAIVIVRLRFVMDKHLDWLETHFPEGFVKANGDQWYNRPLVVRSAFQLVLLLAAGTSLILLISTATQTNWSRAFANMNTTPSLQYYDDHAVHLADLYDSVDPRNAHPALHKRLQSLPEGTRLRILDVGAGSGRDASWLASLGHSVTAVEPSAGMRRIGQAQHPTDLINWRDDALPELKRLESEEFDLIVASAVWMHLAHEDRRPALRRMSSLLAEDGQLYLTLRIGPANENRGIFDVTLEDTKIVAEQAGMAIEVLSEQADLLGRSDVRWVSVAVKAP